LGLADIFDGAFRSIRFAPSVMFGLTAVVMVVAAIAQTVPTYLMEIAPLMGDAYGETLDYGLNSLLTGGIGMIVSFLATTILSGMLTYAVAQGAIGRRVTVGSAWRTVRGRVPALIGLSLLIGLMVLAAALLPFAVMIAGLALADLGKMVGAGVAVIFLGLLALFAACFWVVVRTMLAPAAVVLEGQGVIAAIKRGWRLSSRRFWRLFGIYLLTSLIVGVVSGIFSVPMSIAMGLAVFEGSPALGAAALTLGTALAGTITTPFTASVVALLYIDSRIRSEGLDLTLMSAAEEDRL
jgi:hypothetical protein